MVMNFEISYVVTTVATKNRDMITIDQQRYFHSFIECARMWRKQCIYRIFFTIESGYESVR